MRLWISLAVALGTIAARMFVKNKNSQQVEQAAEQAAAVVIDAIQAKPEKPKA